MQHHVIERTAPERGFRRNPLPLAPGNYFVRDHSQKDRSFAWCVSRCGRYIALAERPHYSGSDRARDQRPGHDDGDRLGRRAGAATGL